MTADLYAQSKPLWHPDRLADLRAGRRPKPVHVQIILSDLCNQSCTFCAYRMETGLSSELFKTKETINPNRMIPTDKALEILDDCATMGVKAIQFTGGGEPTVHPDHREIFAHAQRLGMETALVTNGVRLDAGSPAMRGHTWIRVSVDAGDAETYARLRQCPKSHWSKVWENIAELRHWGYTGTLGVGFVVTPENYTGIIHAAVMAKQAGASYMRVGAVFSAEGPAFYTKEAGGDIIPLILQQIIGAKAVVDGDGFEIVDLFGRRLDDLIARSPTEAFCGYQYLTVYIGGDLNVYRCCNTAYTPAGLLGSLKEQRFLDAVLAYEPFDATGCRFCQFLGQNKAINAVMAKPTHVNFV